MQKNKDSVKHRQDMRFNQQIFFIESEIDGKISTGAVFRRHRPDQKNTGIDKNGVKTALQVKLDVAS